MASPTPPLNSAYALRIALAYCDTLMHEQMVAPGRPVTVGHAPGCTFVLPTGAGQTALGRVKVAQGDELYLSSGLTGHVYIRGESNDVAALVAAGHTRVSLGAEDWALLSLTDQPQVRLVIQRVRGAALGPMRRQFADGLLLNTTLISAALFAVWMVVSFLRYDPDAPELTLDELDPRMVRAMFNYPPEEEDIPEEEPEVSTKEEPEEKARKRAGGDEGKFGRPDRTQRSNVPKKTEEQLLDEGKVGLVRELDALARSDSLAALTSVGQEISGLDDGDLVVGAGSYGMSTRGSGAGGGGEGEGVIAGTGAVDVGGKGVKNRRRKVKGSGKPKERKVSVRTGTARVKGQLSKELIDREVRRHRAQIKFCYNKELTRNPNLGGKVTLHWVIKMDGGVSGAKVRSSSLGSKSAESCMVRALSNWKFPRPTGGVVSVDYPFFFGGK